jgi:presenilin enhancer 2
VCLESRDVALGDSTDTDTVTVEAMDRAEEQLTPDKMKLIAKRLFIGGFFLLPFLWLVNAFYFRRYYKHPATPELVRRYVRMSLTAFALSLALWLGWLLLYYTQHDSWAALGDLLTVVTPTA